MYKNSSKGITRLSVIPVRKEPADQSEMVTQLLFGEHFEIVETSIDDKWLRIKNFFDDYEGWIDKKQFTPISEAFYSQLKDFEFKITTEMVSRLDFNDKQINLLPGSILPFFENEMFTDSMKNQFKGNSKSVGVKYDYDMMEKIAFMFINAPYLWGGKTPFGIDCSGFTQLVFRIGGYALKRDAWQQQQQGELVMNNTIAKPGDLAFFAKEDGRINHVGIVLKDKQIIHASGRVRIDKLDNKGIFIDEDHAYSHLLHSIKRIINI